MCHNTPYIIIHMLSMYHYLYHINTHNTSLICTQQPQYAYASIVDNSSSPSIDMLSSFHRAIYLEMEKGR